MTPPTCPVAPKTPTSMRTRYRPPNSAVVLGGEDGTRQGARLRSVAAQDRRPLPGTPRGACGDSCVGLSDDSLDVQCVGWCGVRLSYHPS